MKNAKHTPGPWKREYQFTHFVIRGPNGETVADHVTFATDAVAIAALPDMLVALRGCIFALGRAGANVASGPYRAEWEKARAAFDKATGQS